MQGEEDKQAHYSCLFERERDPGPHQVVGISSGWIDIYYYFMPDQYVEISGVADGVYALELEIDPRDVFVEASEANNRACVVFKLEGTEATLLDPMPRC